VQQGDKIQEKTHTDKKTIGKGDEMIFIYHDFGGTHTTSMAAAIHLRLLPDREWTDEEILEIPDFNQLKKKDAGHLFFKGTDHDGHDVYTIGKRSSKYVLPAMKDVSKMLLSRYDRDGKIIFSNTSPVVPPVMTAGGFFARGLGLDAIGVPLLLRGAKQCRVYLEKLVEETKRNAYEIHQGQILDLENKYYQYKKGKKL
jgi:hypothetical protein